MAEWQALGDEFLNLFFFFLPGFLSIWFAYSYQAMFKGEKEREGGGKGKKKKKKKSSTILTIVFNLFQCSLFPYKL